MKINPAHNFHTVGKEIKLSKKMKADKNFVPCPVDDEDELFPNGFFEFNITKIVDYIQKHPDEITLETVAVDNIYIGSSVIDESHLESVDVGKPVIMAEIAPGRYNLIDGNHRAEKARRLGIQSLQAYRLNVDQHIKFLIQKKSYLAYVEYWNKKLKDYGMQ